MAPPKLSTATTEITVAAAGPATTDGLLVDRWVRQCGYGYCLACKADQGAVSQQYSTARVATALPELASSMPVIATPVFEGLNEAGSCGAITLLRNAQRSRVKTPLVNLWI